MIRDTDEVQIIITNLCAWIYPEFMTHAYTYTLNTHIYLKMYAYTRICSLKSSALFSAFVGGNNLLAHTLMTLVCIIY